MGKAAGVSRRRKKLAKGSKIKHRNKLQKQKAKNRRETGVVIKNSRMRSQWDDHKTVQQNLQDMGLAYDPNKILSVPSTRDNLGLPSLELMDIDHKPSSKKGKKLVDDLQEDAEKLSKKKKKKKTPIKLGTEVSKFVVYMMEKHGDDFEGMQRDKKNVYQYSAGQIKGLIKKFLSNPINRNAYMRAQESKDQEMTCDD